MRSEKTIGYSMDIKTETTNLEQIFSGFQKKYTVPDYQRDYSWKRDQVEELWTDIITSKKSDTEYFMGTIVLNAGDNEDQFEIIDGQQRLSTFALLFSVIASIGNSFNLNNKIFPQVVRNLDNEDKAKRMHNMARERLYYTSEPDNYYLTINKKDRDIFDEQVKDLNTVLTEESELSIKSNDSRVIKTKKIFFKLIRDEFEQNTDALADLYKTLIHFLKRLKFIKIVVTSDYDAFLLFESLNSKGMDLSIADLVKNKLLMHCSDSGANREKLLLNWDDMICLLDNKSRVSVVDYLRIYWMSFIIKNNITKKELYKEIKNYLDSNRNAFEFSEALKIKAEIFSEFTDKNLVWPVGEHHHKKVLKTMSEINTLKYTLCYPLLLYVSVNRKDIYEELTQISLSYLFRWITIGDLSVSEANVIFIRALVLLKDGETDKKKIFELFRSDSKINDEEFKKSFKSYQFKENTIPKYILGKIHTYSNNNDQVPNFDNIHLEHVLPVKPDKWINEKNSAFANDQNIDKSIYHLGNLTLLNKTINQNISNSIFSLKVKEYENSTFPMTEEIVQQFNAGNHVWNTQWMEKRAESWADLAVKIWSLDIN